MTTSNTKGPRKPDTKLVEFRYQLWTRLCEAADELMSIADAWYETDPDLVDLHSRQCGFSAEPPSEDEFDPNS